MSLGILVHGDNHFIVRGPLPSSGCARALARHWSIIRIDAPPAPEFERWRISTREFRENLEWAVLAPGERAMTNAVGQLLCEMAARGIEIHDAASGEWQGESCDE